MKRFRERGLVTVALLLGMCVAMTPQGQALQVLLTGVGGHMSAQTGSLNAGDIVIRTSACGAGFTEVAALAGQTVIGTLNASGDVGATGGANDITPEGTNSGGAVSAHTGTAVADHASHTHTYTDVVNHTHPQAVNSATTGGLSGYTPDTSSNTSTTSGYSTGNPTGGVATGTTAGPSATLTHSVTQPGNHTFTQPAFAGTPFDNRSAFTKVIFCQKS